MPAPLPPLQLPLLPCSLDPLSWCSLSGLTLLFPPPGRLFLQSTGPLCPSHLQPEVMARERFPTRPLYHTHFPGYVVRAEIRLGVGRGVGLGEGASNQTYSEVRKRTVLFELVPAQWSRLQRLNKAVLAFSIFPGSLSPIDGTHIHARHSFCVAC